MLNARFVKDIPDRLLEAFWKATNREVTPEGVGGGIDARSEIAVQWPAKYQWHSAHLWVDGLLDGIRNSAEVTITEIPQIFPGIVVFYASLGDRAYPVAIDYSDYSTLNMECVDDCILYFKMQFSTAGYELDHVIPGGFVSRDNDIYAYLPSLRRLRDQKSFSYDIYGRFGPDYAASIRSKAISRLRTQTQFSYEGGLSTVRLSRSLREVARSRACIDLPGNGAFCFRLVDYFAVGACVISYPHANRLPEPLVDRRHIVYCKGDLSDLVDICAYYLEHDQEREEICLNSRRYFDEHLHRQQLANYYLEQIHQCLRRLP
jgi:hypothetical protein